MNAGRLRFSTLAAVLFCTFLTSTARVLWKSGVVNLPEFWAGAQIASGFVLYGIAAVIFLYLLKTGDVSILFPIFASSYIWVTLAAGYYFSEPLTLLKWAGILAIFCGAIVLGTSEHKHPEAVV